MHQVNEILEKLVKFPCAASCGSNIESPVSVMGKDGQKDYEFLRNHLYREIKNRFHNKTLRNGVYVSKIEFSYCCRECWADFICERNWQI